MKSTRPRSTKLLCLSLLLCGLGLASAIPGRAQTDDNRYGYVRTLEGTATVTQSNGGEQQTLALHQPVLVGDTIAVANGSRLELSLADGSVLRVDGGSVLELLELAASPDRNDQESAVRLHRGNLVLVVNGSAIAQRAPNIETPNATIYPSGAGRWRVTTDHNDWTEVVARVGSADVATDSGNVPVAAGQDLIVRGEQQSRSDLRPAAGDDALEQWGTGLDRELQAEVQAPGLSNNVDPGLQTEAASLSRYGNWIQADNTEYWRPSGVDADWSPYWNGSWSYTPTGYSWVSSEPWGWAPYHYGSWEYLSSYGWAWRPGAVFAPSWVYWYWGPSYVGWCPIGYYSGFYGGFFPGINFRFGLLGFAGGFGFRHWNFVDFDHFGHRDWRGFGFHGEHFAGRGLERGFITTDTRRLSPAVLRQPGHGLNALGAGARGQMTDVSRFVARDAHLSGDVLRAVRSEGGAARGTALAPSTLGRGAQGSRLAQRSNGGARSFGTRSFNSNLHAFQPFNRQGSSASLSENRTGTWNRSTTPSSRGNLASGVTRGSNTWSQTWRNQRGASQPAYRGSAPSFSPRQSWSQSTQGVGRQQGGATSYQSRPSAPRSTWSAPRSNNWSSSPRGSSSSWNRPSAPPSWNRGSSTSSYRSSGGGGSRPQASRPSSPRSSSSGGGGARASGHASAGGGSHHGRG